MAAPNALRKVLFTVEGEGHFPIDMLRYDRAWPKSEADSSAIPQAYRKRQVRLIGEHVTAGRWNSFNWKVIKSEEVRF